MGPGGISKEATERQKGASTRETSENRHRLPRRPLVRGRCRLLGSKPAGQTTPNGPLAARNQYPASVRLEHICPGEGKAHNWRPPRRAINFASFALRSSKAADLPASPFPNHRGRPARFLRPRLGSAPRRVAQGFRLAGRVHVVVHHVSPSPAPA